MPCSHGALITNRSTLAYERANQVSEAITILSAMESRFSNRIRHPFCTATYSNESCPSPASSLRIQACTKLLANTAWPRLMSELPCVQPISHKKGYG
jgi:hypothetical protein